ncbi:hypothetical protein EK21DRAFT_85001 [Setomelanomma holmii]|uniref:Uncharacterized protein n=1 Tax=Setomelanomma holmii TaxID=210430 RepID=A0A9P4HH37_9PLEO|nr:hypothetical protein EK21DRAFT_85001 [Setomelanomma holmii]
MGFLYIETPKWKVEILSSADDCPKSGPSRNLHSSIDSSPRRVFGIRRPRLPRSYRLGPYRVYISRNVRKAEEVASQLAELPEDHHCQVLAESPFEASGNCLFELVNPQSLWSIPELSDTLSVVSTANPSTICSWSSSTIHELPSPICASPPMTPLIHHNGVFELETHVPANFVNRQNSAQWNPDPTSGDISHFLDKSFDPLPVREAFHPTQSQAVSLTLQIGTQPSVTPDMTNEDAESTLSPISPITPHSGEANNTPMQQQPDVSPVRLTASPDQDFLTPLAHSEDASQLHDTDVDYIFQRLEATATQDRSVLSMNALPLSEDGFQGPRLPSAIPNPGHHGSFGTETGLGFHLLEYPYTLQAPPWSEGMELSLTHDYHDDNLWHHGWTTKERTLDISIYPMKRSNTANEAYGMRATRVVLTPLPILDRLWSIRRKYVLFVRHNLLESTARVISLDTSARSIAKCNPRTAKPAAYAARRITVQTRSASMSGKSTSFRILGPASDESSNSASRIRSIGWIVARDPASDLELAILPYP